MKLKLKNYPKTFNIKNLLTFVRLSVNNFIITPPLLKHKITNIQLTQKTTFSQPLHYHHQRELSKSEL